MLLMSASTGWCDKWIVRELQRLGNEEERAGAGLHVQPHQHCLHGGSLRLHLGGDHQARKVDSCFFLYHFSRINEGEVMKCLNRVRPIYSLAGMFLMFTGLYFVLWAKGKEGLPESDDRLESEFDAEKPLLSWFNDVWTSHTHFCVTRLDIRT